MKTWAERARCLKVELLALYLAARHPQTRLAMRFVPAPVLAECRGRAHERVAIGRSSWIPIAAVWLVMAAAGVAFCL